MGFIEDFFNSDTLKDAMAIRDEFDNFKQEVASSLIESATNIKSTLDDTANEATSLASESTETVRKTTDISDL